MDGAFGLTAQFAATPRPVSVAIDPVALVVTECITVTSAMRKHARWAQSSVSAILGGAIVTPRLEVQRNSVTSRTSLDRRKPSTSSSTDTLTVNAGDDIGLASRWGLRGKKGQSMQDNPLLSAFAKLRGDLKRCKGTVAVRCRRCRGVINKDYHRYPHHQRALNPSSFPPSHSILLYVCSNHFTGPHCNQQVLCIRHHWSQIRSTTTGHATTLLRRHSLSLRGQRVRH